MVLSCYSGPNFSRLFQCLALGRDARQQIVPGLIERLGPFPLEPSAKGVDVDARPAEAVQHLLTVAAIGRQQVADPAVIGECPQRRLGDRVDRERGGQRLEVKHVGGFGVLGARTGPQQALRPSAFVQEALPAGRIEQLPVSLVGPPGDGDAELVTQSASGALPSTALSQRLMNNEATDQTWGL